MEPGPKSIDNVRLENMIRNHDIEKIEIVKQKEQARIYLDPAAADHDTDYVNAFKANKNGPHYFIDITDASSFKEEVVNMELAAFQRDTAGMTDWEKAAYEQSHKNIVINVDNSKSWGSGLLVWLFPMLLLFLFFFLSTRNMGMGGAAV